MKPRPSLLPRIAPFLSVFTLALLSPRLLVPAAAQVAGAGEEAGEYIEMSPFLVASSEDRGYAVAATRQAKAIREIPGLRFENREVQLATGNRSRSIIGKGGLVTSFANFAVFADLSDDVRLYERVKQVRNLVTAAKLHGDTRTIDGPVALFIKRPNELRGELLTKVFDDLAAIKQGLGEEFEVLVNGLSGPVQLRSCSESEIELWVDYSFSIRSLREMESKRPVEI